MVGHLTSVQTTGLAALPSVNEPYIDGIIRGEKKDSLLVWPGLYHVVALKGFPS